LSVFPSAIGWIGLVGRDNRLIDLFVGHSSAESLRSTAARSALPGTVLRESDWSPALRARLVCYASGQRDDLADVEVELPQLTRFQKRVLAVTRKISYGHSLTYAEVARRAGAPRAARAVGQVMASNRLPIVIPCHRVVAAGGRLGGYSAPQGASLKAYLLELEAAAAGS
jgi:methylated-DNA-[protein]-cysteine S-methyltransferase